MKNEIYAHSIPDAPIEKWQHLEEHLLNVAEMAFEFAKPFGGENWSRLSGLHHDFGKGTLAWQAYLRHANKITDDFAKYYKGSVKHAGQGAQLLYGLSNEAGKLLAYCIAGHHGGLPNWHGSREAGLKSRLETDYDGVTFVFI